MSWIANILIIVGLFILGNKDRKAFIFTFIGEVLWFTHALLHQMYDLAFICAIFSTLALRNYIKESRRCGGIKNLNQ